uniref:Tetraspanin n=1 Tax=Ailuropoda melanoleuca TaxID=9646 RepID=A0A7N5P9V5_AILME
MAVSGGMKCVKFLVFIFNFLFWIAGIALIGLGIYVQVQMNKSVVISNASSSGVPIVLLIVGAVIFVVSFFGCCGAWKENYCMVTTLPVSCFPPSPHPLRPMPLLNPAPSYVAGCGTGLYAAFSIDSASGAPFVYPLFLTAPVYKGLLYFCNVNKKILKFNWVVQEAPGLVSGATPFPTLIAVIVGFDCDSWRH